MARDRLPLAPDHVVKALDDRAGLDKRRNTSLHRGNRHRVCLRQGVAPGSHQQGDGSGRGHAVEHLGIDPFGLPAARHPFRHNPQRTTKALRFQAPPEFGPVPISRRPLIIEPRQIGFQRALTNSEDIATFTAQDPTDQVFSPIV